MKIFQIQNIAIRIIPVFIISLSALLASAQPSGHLSPPEADTVKSSFLNRSIYEFHDQYGQLNRIQLKKGEKHGFTEIYQNGVLVEKTKYKKGEKNGYSDTYYTNGIKHIAALNKNGIRSGKYRQYYISRELKLEAKYKIFTIATLKKSLYNGAFRTFDQNGEVLSEGDYVRGEKTGVWKEYSQGKLVKSEIYKNGESWDNR